MLGHVLHFGAPGAVGVPALSVVVVKGPSLAVVIAMAKAHAMAQTVRQADVAHHHMNPNWIHVVTTEA